MESEQKELIYQGIFRMVIWGEPKDDVLRKLEVNGIIGKEALSMYAKAFRERVATIRSGYWKKVNIGSIWLVAGLGLFCFLWFLIGGITNQLLIICGAVAAIGFWNLIWGFSGIIQAPVKEGSISDS